MQPVVFPESGELAINDFTDRLKSVLHPGEYSPVAGEPGV